MEPEEIALPIPGAPVAAPAPILPAAPAPGGMLPIPGPISQQSAYTSQSTSRKVATPGLSRAMRERAAAGRERLSADAQSIGAAEQQSSAIRLRQDADALTAKKNLALEKIAAKDANDILRGKQKVESEARSRIAAQELQYKQMSNDSFWGEQKTWQKVLWGVSLALGGFGAALSRSQNTPLLMLTKTIDDWADRHEGRMKTLQAEIATGRSKLGTVGAEYAAREMGLKELRKAAAFDKVADVTEKEAEKLAAAGNAEAAARAQKVVAEARAKSAENREASALKEEQSQQFLAPSVTTEKRTGNVVQAPSAAAMKLNEKQITEARKAIAAQQRIDKMYDKLQAHLEEHGDLLVDPAKRKIRSQLVKNLVAELKGPDFFNLGASLTENEEAILNQASGGVDSTSVIDQLPRLLQGRDFVKNRQRERLQGLGVDRDATEQLLQMDPAQLGAPTAAGKAAQAATAGKPAPKAAEAPVSTFKLKDGTTVRGRKLPNGDIEVVE
jgi:hypothetical protein